MKTTTSKRVTVNLEGVTAEPFGAAETRLPVPHKGGKPCFAFCSSRIARLAHKINAMCFNVVNAPAKTEKVGCRSADQEKNCRRKPKKSFAFHAATLAVALFLAMIFPALTGCKAMNSIPPLPPALPQSDAVPAPFVSPQPTQIILPLRWPEGTGGGVFEVQASRDLQTWETILSEWVGDDLQAKMDGQMRFYRVKGTQ